MAVICLVLVVALTHFQILMERCNSISKHSTFSCNGYSMGNITSDGGLRSALLLAPYGYGHKVECRVSPQTVKTRDASRSCTSGATSWPRTASSSCTTWRPCAAPPTSSSITSRYGQGATPPPQG